jgi:hypothetical protein
MLAFGEGAFYLVQKILDNNLDVLDSETGFFCDKFDYIRFSHRIRLL